MIYRASLIAGIACETVGLTIGAFTDAKDGALNMWSAILYVAGMVLLVVAAYHSPEPISLRNWLGFKKPKPPSGSERPKS